MAKKNVRRGLFTIMNALNNSSNTFMKLAELAAKKEMAGLRASTKSAQAQAKLINKRSKELVDEIGNLRKEYKISSGRLNEAIKAEYDGNVDELKADIVSSGWEGLEPRVRNAYNGMREIVKKLSFAYNTLRVTEEANRRAAGKLPEEVVNTLQFQKLGNIAAGIRNEVSNEGFIFTDNGRVEGPMQFWNTADGKGMKKRELISAGIDDESIMSAFDKAQNKIPKSLVSKSPAATTFSSTQSKSNLPSDVGTTAIQEGDTGEIPKGTRPETIAALKAAEEARVGPIKPVGISKPIAPVGKQQAFDRRLDTLAGKVAGEEEAAADELLRSVGVQLPHKFKSMAGAEGVSPPTGPVRRGADVELQSGTERPRDVLDFIRGIPGFVGGIAEEERLRKQRRAEKEAASRRALEELLGF